MFARAQARIKNVISSSLAGVPGLHISASKEDGGSLLETALMLPIFLMILIALFTFSIVIYQKFELAEAVSIGGRFLAVDRGDTDPCAATATKIYNAAPGLTQSKLTLTFTLNGVATGATCPGASGAANANMISGDNAQILASYPCSYLVFPAFGNSYSSTCVLQAQITEVVQ